MWRIALRWGWDRVGAAVGVDLFGKMVLLLMAIVQLDAIVDWPTTWHLVQQAPAWWHGVTLGSLVAAQGLFERRRLRRVWLASHERLLRQPLEAVDLGVASLTLLGLLALPLGVMGGIATGSGVTALTWTLLGALGMGALGGPRPWRGGLLVVGVVVFGTLTQRFPWLAPLVWLLAIRFGVPWLGRAAREWAIEGGEGRAANPWPQPQSPLAALLHRDAQLLTRRERRRLWESLGLAAALAAVIALMRRNNADSSGLVRGAGLVGTGIAALIAHGGLTALVQRLGTQFDPSPWPVRVRTRAFALVLLAAGLTSPSWAVAAVGGLPVLGILDQATQFALFSALAVGVVGTVIHRPDRPSLGPFLWWMGGVVGTSLALPRLGGLVSVIAGLVGFALCCRALTANRRQQ
ncbi:MAG: hypothetical protein AAGA48_23040 [Myxococcota bacterium]